MLVQIVSYPDGREQMVFYMSFGWWSPTSNFLSHIYIPWGTRQLYNGFRRIFYSLQIDDLFLETEIETTPTYNFRLRNTDAQIVTQWQTAFQNSLPSGSSFRLLFGFNGNGVIEQVKVNNAAEIEYTEPPNDFIMPMGKGGTNWPTSSTTLATLKAYTRTDLAKDPLWSYYFGSSVVRSQYWWTSHTYTHENFSNCSKYDVQNELQYNINFASISGLLNTAQWSGKSMITPQISGLHNGEALSTMASLGITSAPGDTSRADCTNTSYPYSPWVSTMASSNYAGFVVPARQPTVIYYFSTTPNEDTAVYNTYYNATQGFKTWDYIMDTESDRVLALLMALRQDGYMFHQANLRAADLPVLTMNGRTFRMSLIQQWTEYVTGKLLKLVKWPIVSPSMDAWGQAFKDRMARDACGTQVTFTTNYTHVTGFTVTTKGTCKVPVTVPADVQRTTANVDCTYEKLGVDPLTVWVPSKPGVTRTFTLSTPLAVKGKAPGSTATTTASTTAPTSTTPTTTTTTTAAPASTCLAAGKQCGGILWFGVKCCQTGLNCTYRSIFVSQCA
ncbi:hypothetical protein HDV00_007650 [Rhizophlyctis rosea]|nr:hypothetical protein HDV00_007650 [Rhizophlyctis rosea]